RPITARVTLGAHEARERHEVYPQQIAHAAPLDVGRGYLQLDVATGVTLVPLVTRRALRAGHADDSPDRDGSRRRDMLGDRARRRDHDIDPCGLRPHNHDAHSSDSCVTFGRMSSTPEHRRCTMPSGALSST